MRAGAGLALALAVLAGPVAAQSGPRTDPALTAALRPELGPEEYYPELQRLAEAGNPGARAIVDGFTALGMGGHGRPADFPAACRSWESGAAVSAEAAHFTAECYEHGHGGMTDLVRAMDLYRQAGEGGSARSLCALGLIYVAGKGVPADPSRGVELCRQAAETGDANAQTDLGDFYRKGQGVARDYAMARLWYERAAARNQRNAAYHLGTMYWNGDGVAADLETAGLWFERAYRAGRKDAAKLVASAALNRADRTPPRESRDRSLFDHAARWLRVAMEEDPDEEERARAAVALAQLSAEFPQPLP
jgi:TPR repeat protein